MNIYRVKFRNGGAQIVRADSIHGLQGTCDTYIFRIDQVLVAAFPKDTVKSITRVTQRDDGAGAAADGES